MNGTNYVGGIVKILETPKQKKLKNNGFAVSCRVQFAQDKNTRILTLRFWENLARDLVTYYKKNDYLLIEGYLSFRNKKNVSSTKAKRIEITVIKLYPCFSSQNSVQKN
jgi:single-stranded DNA-binding protein